jgi:hypothetical protein
MNKQKAAARFEMAAAFENTGTYHFYNCNNKESYENIFCIFGL